MDLKAVLVTTFVRQNRWHTSGVLGHTMKVVLQVIKHRDYRFLIPALLHDIGKPLVAFQDETDVLHGTYSFTDHEEASYQVVKNWPLSQWTKDMIRWHYLIRDIKKAKEKGKLERYNEKKEIWDNLDAQTKKDLAVFLKYDDLGKKAWKDQL